MTATKYKYPNICSFYKKATNICCDEKHGTHKHIYIYKLFTCLAPVSTFQIVSSPVDVRPLTRVEQAKYLPDSSTEISDIL